MKNIRLLLLLLIYIPSLSYAQDESLISPYQMSIGAAFSVLDEVKESESIGYEAMVGYRLRDYLLLEAGLAHYNLSDSTSEDFTPMVIRFKTMIPVSDYASLYIGGGAAYDGESSPLLTGGVNYRIGHNWYMDVGYQGIFNIESVESDLYSFNISFVYQFSSKEKVVPIVEAAPIVPVVKEQKVSKVVETVDVCVKKSDIYKVKEGDYILSIARQHNMSLKFFLKMNAQFDNRNINLIYPNEMITYNYIDCGL
ncbi:outer membrane beta-barrel protein [Aliivibrio salmonicida]|uniref:outer membrane beta-barrel protein n=1 Tax=Aliivibrio salmonicida TaxID=40269 RepID=UPI003D0D0071